VRLNVRDRLFVIDGVMVKGSVKDWVISSVVVIDGVIVSGRLKLSEIDNERVIEAVPVMVLVGVSCKEAVKVGCNETDFVSLNEFDALWLAEFVLDDDSDFDGVGIKESDGVNDCVEVRLNESEFVNVNDLLAEALMLADGESVWLRVIEGTSETDGDHVLVELSDDEIESLWESVNAVSEYELVRLSDGVWVELKVDESVLIKVDEADSGTLELKERVDESVEVWLGDKDFVRVGAGVMVIVFVAVSD
jgi:hypothetical protein